MLRPFSIAIGILVTGIVLIGTLALGSQPATALGPCTDVQIIGLRGSGEEIRSVEHGMGSLVGPIADAIAAQGPESVTFSFYGVPYPAVAATIDNFLNGDYLESKERGSQMLHDYLQEEISACPSTQLVVIGYSQGAHAAGDQLALEPTGVTDHVSALVMFGDPRFNPEAPYTVGTFDPRYNGLAGKRPLDDFSGWTDRVFSACNQNDVICQGLGGEHGVPAHLPPAYLGAYETIAAGLVRRRLGFPRPADVKTPLDLAFVIDSTGSMGGSIDGVTDAAAGIAEALQAENADFRVGLVDYKDTDQGDPYAARLDLQMTSDASVFAGAVNGLVAVGGGDYPDAVFSGLMKAINDLNWRRIPRKAIIVMGDAPAKDPEPVTSFTEGGVLDAARALDPAVLYPVVVNGVPTEAFQSLADGSGGEVYEAFESGEVEEQVLAAVEEAAVPIIASLTVSSPSRPGVPVPFSAAGSYYDPGEILSYEWDFDGDGVVDSATADNRTTHVYGSPFSGIVSVTVRTNDGSAATATAFVDIRAEAPVAAGPPSHLVASLDSATGSVNIAWGPPFDLGGGTLAGYQVTVEEQVSGRPVAELRTPAATESATVHGLAPGTYRVRVQGVTEAGLGATAETTVIVDYTTPPLDNATLPTDINTAHGTASAVAIPAPFDLSGPVLSRLSVSPRRFRLPHHRAKKSTAVGSWIVFRLSEPATVRFKIARRRSRSRPPRRCAKASSVSRTKSNCERYVRLRGAIVVRGQRGFNKFRFNGRLKNRPLASGRYRLRAIAIDPAGNRSRWRRAAFRIVRR